MVAKLSISQARRIALAAQGFDRERPAKVDKRHLRRVMNQIRIHQLDTIPIVCRPQHLVPFSRLGAYDEELLNKIAYAHDEWFESWAHEASLIPMSDEPLLRWRQADMAKEHHWIGRIADEYVEAVLAELELHGPMLAKELKDPGIKRGTDHAWGGRSEGRIALSVLFNTGLAGSRRVKNFERQYDAIGRVVPTEILHQPTPPRHDAQRRLLNQGARAIGVGTLDDIADYYRIKIPEARPRVNELVEEGILIETQVEGWDKPAYRHAEARLPRSLNASALLSPFDPVVWYRPRCERLFDFYYRIEIYVPAKDRQYGYYVLPYLQGERIVGRVDLKADRKNGCLRVLGAWHEDHADPDEVAAGLTGELSALAVFQKLDQIEVGTKGNLAAALRSAT